MISPVFSPTDLPGVVVLQELFMLPASQEIYSRRVRLVFQNRGKLFEGQYRAWEARLLVNIDRNVFCENQNALLVFTCFGLASSYC